MDLERDGYTGIKLAMSETRLTLFKKSEGSTEKYTLARVHMLELNGSVPKKR